jgi:hypothetical protein
VNSSGFGVLLTSGVAEFKVGKVNDDLGCTLSIRFSGEGEPTWSEFGINWHAASKLTAITIRINLGVFIRLLPILNHFSVIFCYYILP